MFKVKHITKDWKEAGSFAAQINLFGFWDEHCFLTKTGDLGMAIKVGGIDYESLDHAGRDYAVKRLEAAFRSLDDKTRLYQILFKRNRPAIPHAKYENPLVRAAVEQRTAFLEAKADRLYSIEIVWVRYTTLIELPATEKILEVATGDKDFWIIDTVGNYCFLHPAKEGIHSNLNLITDKGTVYTFTLDDIESADPDLKVVIEPTDASSLAAASGIGKLVAASEVTAAQAQAQLAQSHAIQAVEQFRADYPTQALKFDYSFHNDITFGVSAIYHDDRFTYIKSAASEKFAVYELKDGKPDLIPFQLKDGTYILPTIVDKGYLEIGKHKLVFERKAQ